MTIYICTQRDRQTETDKLLECSKNVYPIGGTIVAVHTARRKRRNVHVYVTQRQIVIPAI
jgi:hypothetical protein